MTALLTTIIKNRLNSVALISKVEDFTPLVNKIERRISATVT
jgi:hypothetical protein